MMLRESLAVPSPGYTLRARMRAALGNPWCWPREPALVEPARALCPNGTAVARPGETLFVSVSQPDMKRVSIWRFTYGSPAAPGAPPFGNEARATLGLAARIVSRDLPVLVDTTAPRSDLPAGVAPVWLDGDGHDEALHGRSFGLAMLLAVASRWMQTSVATDLVALAEIASDGSLRGVDGLAPKLAAVAGTALGVARVLVHPSQQDVAQGVLARVNSTITVCAVETVAAAFGHAFGDMTSHAPSAWNGAASAGRAADALFRMTLLGHPLVDWRGVARAAERLAVAPECDARARTKADFAAAIARRHAEGNATLAWPGDELLAGLPRLLQLRCVAHVVQAAGDAGSDDARDRVARAMALVSGDDVSSEAELEVRGAVGRALAALRDYEHAASVLQSAVDGWWSIYRIGEASFSLSELLRVRGFLRDTSAVKALIARLEEFEAEPGVNGLSRAFVRFAAARALLFTGDAARARGMLEDEATWESVPDYVRRSRLRWLANAYDALGKPDAARDVRARLEREGEQTEVVLARLDVALAAGAEDRALEALITTFAGCTTQGARWLLEGATSASERARRLTDEYPY